MIDKYRARRYCSEDPALIENYSAAAADNTQTWDIHHRAEILPCGNYSAATLKKHQLYYNRPAAELIFLPHGEHNRLHMLGNKFWLGKKHTAAAKKKMSLAKIGKKLSAATKKKMSLAKIGKTLSAATKKKMSLAKSGKKCYLFGTHQWTDGVKSVCAKKCPPGFHPGRVCRREQITSDSIQRQND